MRRRTNSYTGNTYLWITALGLMLSQELSAKHFFPCSPEELKAAIVQANINCEDDVIDLQCNLFELTASDNSTPGGPNGLPVIGPDSGHKLVIKNGTIIRSTLLSTPAFRFFEIAAAATLILEKVTLENGLAISASGGQILNHGTLIIKDCILVGFIPPDVPHFNASSGGALFNDFGAKATIIGSNFFGHGAEGAGGAVANYNTLSEVSTTIFSQHHTKSGGGAIYNGPSATINTIRRSVFDQNRGASGGGAIFNEGDDNPAGTIGAISYTTFSFNVAGGTADGGAISNRGNVSAITANTFSNNQSGSPGFGGAISNVADIGIISNCTFSSNVATLGFGGAISNFIGDFTSGTISALTNSTFTLNAADTGGGISNASVMLNVISNIIANNTGNPPDVDNSGIIGGQVAYNLIGNGSNVCPTPFDPANHNLVGNCLPFGTTIDPLLESLANNGGPTLTHALRPLSLAIGNGSNPVPRELKFDQRGPGHPRTIDGSTDIGSFESCVDFDLDGDCDDDNCHCEDKDHNGECDNEHQQ